MSAFDKSGTILDASNAFEFRLSDQLVMIDAAYAEQDLATCASLIDNLYAHFDGAGHQV